MYYVSWAVNGTNTTELISHPHSSSCCLSLTEQSNKMDFPREEPGPILQFSLRLPKALGHFICHSFKKHVHCDTMRSVFVVHGLVCTRGPRFLWGPIWFLSLFTVHLMPYTKPPAGGGHLGQKPRCHSACQPVCPGAKGLFSSWNAVCLPNHAPWSCSHSEGEPFSNRSTQRGISFSKWSA